MDSEQIARVCHETNRAYCQTIGDFSQKPWDDAEDWQRESALKGVWFALSNPNAPASAQHDAWMTDKLAQGWKYGPVKDPEKREHHCIVPYELLPLEQRLKDHLFRAVVSAFVSAEPKCAECGLPFEDHVSPRSGGGDRPHSFTATNPQRAETPVQRETQETPINEGRE